MFMLLDTDSKIETVIRIKESVGDVRALGIFIKYWSAGIDRISRLARDAVAERHITIIQIKVKPLFFIE